MNVKQSGLHRAMSSQLATTGQSALPQPEWLETRLGDLASVRVTSRRGDELPEESENRLLKDISMD